MEFIRKNLITVLVFAACIVGILLYKTYFAGVPSNVLTTDSAAPAVGGTDILQSLSDLKAVTLDPSIFSNPVFTSLVDFGLSIPPEPVGRSNPFAPLSGVRVVSSVAPPSATSTGR